MSQLLSRPLTIVEQQIVEASAHMGYHQLWDLALDLYLTGPVQDPFQLIVIVKITQLALAEQLTTVEG